MSTSHEEFGDAVHDGARYRSLLLRDGCPFLLLLSQQFSRARLEDTGLGWPETGVSQAEIGADNASVRRSEYRLLVGWDCWLDPSSRAAVRADVMTTRATPTIKRSASLLLASTLACATPHENFAMSVRSVDAYQVDDLEELEPGSTAGLARGCHADPIIWLHLHVERHGWTLTTVDATGHVGQWWPSAYFDRTWTIPPEQVTKMLLDRELVEEYESAPDLQRTAELPKLFERATEARQLDDVAPRSNGHWLAIPAASSVDDPVSALVGRGRRLATDRGWYAVGDEHGNLMVAKIAARDLRNAWHNPGCPADLP